jgi:hypothetical protein
MLAAHAWLDAHNHYGRSVCILDPQHPASLRVAQKCGYSHAYGTTFAGDPTSVMSRISSVAS